jgi:hypothetical protein
MVGAANEGIAGSILSSDGSRLYVVTVQSQLHVIETNRRVIAQTVDLSQQQRSLVVKEMVALSSDGKRLFVGMQPNGGSSTEFRLFDTQTWKEVDRRSAKADMRRASLATSAGGYSIYSIQEPTFPQPADTIVNLGITSNQPTSPSAPLLVRKGEDIARVFIGP